MISTGNQSKDFLAGVSNVTDSGVFPPALWIFNLLTSVRLSVAAKFMPDSTPPQQPIIYQAPPPGTQQMQQPNADTQKPSQGG
ncbi:hypothetical protein RUM44_001494 [Polyplax serrata]|uniref:Uncharacterized protein n=1 Tax=Polyplax serrata TaxID=468196 RepID=A0ABR1AK67_POLSC